MRRFTNTTRRHYACSMVLALTLSSFLAGRSDAQSPQSEDVKPVPLFTGSAGFLTSFDGGEAHLGPIVSPILLASADSTEKSPRRVTMPSLTLLQIPI